MADTKEPLYFRLVPSTRRTALAVGFALTAAISAADWLFRPKFSLGLLYLLPVVLAAGPLRTLDVLAISAVCALVRQAFHGGASQAEPLSQLLIPIAGFAAVGLLVREIWLHRAADREYAQDLAAEVERRQTAETALLAQIEATPAAMLTVDARGRITMANAAAHIVLGHEQKPLINQSVDNLLPEIARLRKAPGIRRLLRTMIEGTGYHQNGDPFLAHMWVSSFGPSSDPSLIVVIFDASEELRHHEEGGLYSLTNSARIIMGALWHETRNLASAMRVLVSALTHRPGVAEMPEVEGLWSLVKSLEKVAYSELRPFSARFDETASLRLALEHLRIVVETSFREQGISIEWALASDMPPVTADSHGLLQVFLNLMRNAASALEGTKRKQVTISSNVLDGWVWVRFRNTGPPVSAPESLFRATAGGTDGKGLGLYVSRAIMHSFGGDLFYEPSPEGCCFTVKLAIAPIWYQISGRTGEEDAHSAG